MYESFYGLSELPFELTANPKYLYLSAVQREALSILQYGLSSAKALTLLVGDAGTGKTTLIQSALQSERCCDVRCVYLNNPTLGADDFVRLLARKFEFSPETGESKALFLGQLEALLLERHAAGVTTALVVDEAQSVSFEMLEEIRFLANIETVSAKLLPVILSGQPELAERLEEPRLRQLKQRVTLRTMLQPFEIEDTSAYIASRIATAGGVPGRMFSLEAVTLIHEMSRGVPRTISVICDNALVNGMALGRHFIDRAIVAEVCHDLRLTSAPAAAPVKTSVAPARIAQVPPPPTAIAGTAATVPEAEADEQLHSTVLRHEHRRSTAAPLYTRLGRTIT